MCWKEGRKENVFEYRSRLSGHWLIAFPQQQPNHKSAPQLFDQMYALWTNIAADKLEMNQLGRSRGSRGRDITCWVLYLQEKTPIDKLLPLPKKSEMRANTHSSVQEKVLELQETNTRLTGQLKENRYLNLMGHFATMSL